MLWFEKNRTTLYNKSIIKVFLGSFRILSTNSFSHLYESFPCWLPMKIWAPWNDFFEHMQMLEGENCLHNVLCNQTTTWSMKQSQIHSGWSGIIKWEKFKRNARRTNVQEKLCSSLEKKKWKVIKQYCFATRLSSIATLRRSSSVAFSLLKKSL